MIRSLAPAFAHPADRFGAARPSARSRAAGLIAKSRAIEHRIDRLVGIDDSIAEAARRVVGGFDGSWDKPLKQLVVDAYMPIGAPDVCRVGTRCLGLIPKISPVWERVRLSNGNLVQWQFLPATDDKFQVAGYSASILEESLRQGWGRADAPSG